jgi:excinuclease ABC subunit C
LFLTKKELLFKIKGVDGQSDVDCLKEVLERRLRHKEWILPDIILVDGGKPQINVFRKILKDKIFVFGIAKGKDRKKDEFIFLDKDKECIDFILNNKKLFLNVRDEAHRFAINYQRKLSFLK